MAPSSDARARRAFGQNFLTSRTALHQVVAAASLTPDDLVYEVGAGTGNLTRRLLAGSAEVIAYEVDPAVAATLPHHPRLTVRIADFLHATPPRSPFRVVGNVPYTLTSSVVDWCLAADSLRDATLVTQLEYARKRAGDYNRWSRLTISTWPTHDWRLAGRIPRTAFRPIPRVDAGILRLIHRPIPLIPDRAMRHYRDFVDLGFTGVGGSLLASLSRHYPGKRVAAAFRANRLAPDTSVGLVWPEQWLNLFRQIT